jgi:signal recognition particle subunit SRP54
MGDIVALVEKAAETIDAEKAQRIADKMRKGKFDLDDLADQLAQVDKLGGIGGIMGMLPGMGKIKEQMAAAKIDGKMIARQRAIILSMTPQERRNPDILKASRKKRIAAGSGAKVEDVNKLLKQHRTMADMMKSLGGAKRGPMAQMAQMFGLGGGMPQPSPEQIAELQGKFGGGAGMGAGIPQNPPPGAFPPKPTLPGSPGSSPGSLPGLPGAKPGLPGLPGLGGLNPFGKKK